ncbi:DUF2066 domain-containing protein [Thalassotalea montiporae]
MKLIQLNKMFHALVLILTTFSIFSAAAIEVTDLYQAKVAVDSQANKDRNQAIKKAMAAVLLKVGGQESVLINGEVKRQLNRYNQYLTQYRYERDSEQLFLVAMFDENKINQLFQQQNLAIWGSLRPQILVWLLNENDLNREVVAESAGLSWPKQVNDFSEQRGLPLLLPLMDLEDTLQVNVTDLWGRFADATEQAAARYFVDANLIIRISNSSLLSEQDQQVACEGVLCQQPSWYAVDWSLLAERQQFGETYEGSDVAALLSQVLKDVASVVYQDYALSTDLNNELLIDVANVDSLTSYVEIHQFLTALSAVESVTLVEAEEQTRTFKLNLLGSKKALLASLKLNDQLQQYIDPLVGEEPGANPVFYWRKQ